MPVTMAVMTPAKLSAAPGVPIHQQRPALPLPAKVYLHRQGAQPAGWPAACASSAVHAGGKPGVHAGCRWHRWHGRHPGCGAGRIGHAGGAGGALPPGLKPTLLRGGGLALEGARDGGLLPTEQYAAASACWPHSLAWTRSRQQCGSCGDLPAIVPQPLPLPCLALQPLLLQQVFWGSPAPGVEAGQVMAQVLPCALRFAGHALLGHAFCAHRPCCPLRKEPSIPVCATRFAGASSLLQSPAEMFATACLLGDLFPPEWPAVGRKATQVGWRMGRGHAAACAPVCS